jgi:hypothetical protein
MTTDECDEAISCLEEQLAIRLAGKQLRLMVLTRQQAEGVLNLLRGAARRGRGMPPRRTEYHRASVGMPL